MVKFWKWTVRDGLLVKALHTTRHKMGHFGVALPSQSLD